MRCFCRADSSSRPQSNLKRLHLQPTDIMHVTSKVLAGFLILSSHAVAAAPGCAGGIYALIATQLSSFQPAQSYCTTKYPVAPATKTKTAPPVTSEHFIAVSNSKLPIISSSNVQFLSQETVGHIRSRLDSGTCSLVPDPVNRNIHQKKSSSVFL